MHSGVNNSYIFTEEQYTNAIHNMSDAAWLAFQWGKNTTLNVLQEGSILASTAWGSELAKQARSSLYDIATSNGVTSALVGLGGIVQDLNSGINWFASYISTNIDLSSLKEWQAPEIKTPSVADLTFAVNAAVNYAKENWVAVTFGLGLSTHYAKNFSKLLDLNDCVNLGRGNLGLDRQSLFSLSNLSTTTLAMGLQGVATSLVAFATFAPVMEVKPVIALSACVLASIANHYASKSLNNELTKLSNSHNTHIQSQQRADMLASTLGDVREELIQEKRRAGVLEVEGERSERDFHRTHELLCQQTGINNRFARENQLLSDENTELNGLIVERDVDITVLTRRLANLCVENERLLAGVSSGSGASTSSSPSKKLPVKRVGDNHPLARTVFDIPQLAAAAQGLNPTVSLQRPLDDQFTKLVKGFMAAEENRQRAKAGLSLMIE